MGAEALQPNVDPLAWWASNEHLYPHLSKAAAVVLSAPPGSIASEQLFSTVSDLYARQKRNRLSLSNTKKLVFLNKCMPVIDYKYDLVSVGTQENSAESESSDIDAE